MKVTVPHDSDEIFDSALLYSKNLIKIKYWDKVSLHELSAWCNNFSSKEERYLASATLRSIKYRNEKSILAFGAQVFQVDLPKIMSQHFNLKINNIREWLQQLNQFKKSFPIRFSAIEGFDGKPAKSGAVIYRIISKRFFNKKYGISSNIINSQASDVKAIVLFDDVVGTGDQFIKFIEKFSLGNKEIKIFYFPFAAQSDGIKRIKEKYRNVYIYPAEILSPEEKFFSDKNPFFQAKETSSADDYKKYYLHLCRKNRIPIKDCLGYGNLEMTYLFHDSVPNNNLSFLWYPNSKWNKLVTR